MATNYIISAGAGASNILVEREKDALNGDAITVKKV